MATEERKVDEENLKRFIKKEEVEKAINFEGFVECVLNFYFVDFSEKFLVLLSHREFKVKLR